MSDVVGGVSVLVSADTTGLAAEMAAGMEAGLTEATAALESGLAVMSQQLTLFGHEAAQALVPFTEQLKLPLGPIRSEVDELSASFERLKEAMPFSLAGTGGFNADAQAMAAAIREANAASLEWAQQGSRAIDEALIQSATDAKNTELAFGGLSTELGAMNARMLDSIAPVDELNVAMTKIIGEAPEAAAAMRTMGVDPAGTESLTAALNEAQQAATRFATGGARAVQVALEADTVAAEEMTAAVDEAVVSLGAAKFDNLDSFAGIKTAAAGAGDAIYNSLGGAFSRAAEFGRNALGATFDAATSAAEGLAVVLTAGVVGGLVEGLKAANQFAKVQDTFTAITGSATQAQDIIVSLRQTAIQTGQSFENISRFSQQLLAAGVQGVPEIANALAVYATAFGRNTQSMQRAATQLQEIQLKGTLQAQQLNALVRDGVPAYQAATVAAENLGLAQKGAADEGTQVTDAMKAGKISAQAFFNALGDPSVIAKASATVAALNTNIGFQLQKLQTEMVHTLGQIFTPLFQTLGTAVEPITDALAKITLNAPGLQAVGNIIASLFNATVAKWAQDIGKALSYVADQLERLAENKSLGNMTDQLTKIAPLAEAVGGFVATIGARGLASFVPFLDVGLNPVVGAFLALSLSSKAVRDDISTLAGDAAKLAGILGSALTPALQGVQGVLSQAASAAQPFLDSISGLLTTAGQALKSGDTATFWQSVNDIASVLGAGLTQALQTGLNAIKWDQVGKEGSNLLNHLVNDVLVPFFSNFDWQGTGTKLGKDATPLIVGFVEGIDWGSMAKLLGLALLNAMESVFSNPLNFALGPAAGTISDAFVQLIANGFKGAGKTVEQAMGEITAPFAQLPGDITRALGQGLVDAITGPFKKAFDLLVGHSIIPEGIAAIVAAFAGLPGQVGGIISNFADGVIGQFARMANGAVQQVANMVGVLWGQFASMASGVIGQVASMVGGVVGQLAGMVGGAVQQAASMASGVVAQAWAMAGQAWGAASSFAQNIAGGIASGVGNVMSAAGSLVHQAISAAQGAVSGAEAVGQTIASGIASGISGAVQGVISAAEGVVSSAVSAAQAATKPGSPSKLTRDLVGKPLGEGIALGIDLSVGKVQQSATAAVNAAVVAAQGSTVTATSTPGSPASTGSGVSITNNAYGPDPASVISELNRQQQFKLAALGVA